MKTLLLISLNNIILIMVITWLCSIAFETKAVFKIGYDSGVKASSVDKKRFADSLNSLYLKRFQFADSIRKNCTWDGGLPSLDDVNKRLSKIDSEKK